MSAKNIYQVPAHLWNQLNNDERNEFNYKFLGGVQIKDVMYSEIFNPNIAINVNAGMYLERLPSTSYNVNDLVRVTDPVTLIPEFYICNTAHVSGLVFSSTNRDIVVGDNNVRLRIKDTTAIADAYFKREPGMLNRSPITTLGLNTFVTVYDFESTLGKITEITLYDGTNYYIYNNLIDKIDTRFTIKDNYDGTWTWTFLLDPLELPANIDLSLPGSFVTMALEGISVAGVAPNSFILFVSNVLLDEHYPPLVYDPTSTITVSDGTNTYVYTDLTTQIANGNIIVAPGLSYYQSYSYTLVNDPAGNPIPGFDPTLPGGFVEVSFKNRAANLDSHDYKNIKTYERIDMKQHEVPGIVTGAVGSEDNKNVSIIKKFLDKTWNDLIKQTYHRIKQKGRFNM